MKNLIIVESYGKFKKYYIIDEFELNRLSIKCNERKDVIEVLKTIQNDLDIQKELFENNERNKID